MGIQDLQIYIQNGASGGAVSVDLLRIARNKKPQHPGRKLRLVLDAECCLDRLYGGYFSDWASGGQWNRMVQFLSILCQNLALNGIELVVFFNGALEMSRMGQWTGLQAATRRNTASVLRHLQGKGTPPPKVWWVAPVCLRTALRMALRHLNISVVCSMDDHHQEVIAYCRENNFHGLLVEDPEYAAFDPPRYFSSGNLKLTYKGSLETKEYLLSRVAETLQITASRLPILAALLGTPMFGEEELAPFHHRLCPEHPAGKAPGDAVLKAVADFLHGMGPAAEDPEAVVSQVFSSAAPGSKDAIRAAKLRSAIQYYLNGTKDGFLKYRTPYRVTRQQKNNKGKNKLDNKQSPTETLKFASETAESEQASLAAYKEAMANSTSLAPEIVVEPPGAMGDHVGGQEHSEDHVVNGGLANGVSGLQLSTSSSSSNSSAASPSHAPSTSAVQQSTAQSSSSSSSTWQQQQAKTEEVSEARSMMGFVSAEVLRTACERHQKGLMSPYIYHILTQGEIKLPSLLEEDQHKELPSGHHLFRPVRQMVYGILFNLHHLTFIQTHPPPPSTTPSSKTDKTSSSDASTSSATNGNTPHHPAQQQRQGLDPESIVVREWVWTKTNQYAKPEMVKPEKVGWGVPTIQRLWFGSLGVSQLMEKCSVSSAHSSTIDDKRRRLRAFLSCMRSDTPLMLSPSHVPQPMLLFACVVRFMMTFPERPILRRHELDALIAQAHAPELMNATYLQDLQLPRVSARGVQLATLAMCGVENALLANDACGAPIPWLMCCPWLFFDGKLFQHKLLKAETCKNLVELCDHRIDEVIKVERMRQAILEGFNPQFARMPLMSLAGTAGLRSGGVPAGMSPMSILPTGAPLMSGVRPSGGGGGRSQHHNSSHHNHHHNSSSSSSSTGRHVLARGGQLEIAGVVVGQWGANYGSNGVATGVGGNRGVGRGVGVANVQQQQQQRGYQGSKSYNSYGSSGGHHTSSMSSGIGYPTMYGGGGRSRGGSVVKTNRVQSRPRGLPTTNRRTGGGGRGTSGGGGGGGSGSGGSYGNARRDTKGRGATVSVNGTTMLASEFLDKSSSGGVKRSGGSGSSGGGGGRTDPMLEIGQFEDATPSSLGSGAAAAAH